MTKDNLAKVLEYLGFTKENEIYSKHYESVDCDVKVDFKNGKIEYPETKGFEVNERQTCNLSDPENFVVLECVNRLLEKGYQPNHIELEPRWKLGHNPKSGRADIWVRTFKKIDGKETEEKQSLLIIECKTADGEFNGAWKDTLDDGAQLFSYYQQERATKFLCLYTSDFVEDKIKNEYHLINVQDNDELLATLKEPKTYKDSKNNKELFATWKETYQQDSATRGLFEPDIAAYAIGKNKYSVADLEEIGSESMQKKYNEFATILRQHNVSGHENAFDKLVNLFLAKVVDETNNPKSLDFYWKGAAYDDYFHLQDRLQKLYKIGMRKFLGEDVTYIDNKEVEDAFRLFKNDPDATKKTILEYFRQLKFFTNNDFAFIDVHNEHLFYQNSAVLLKVVKMLQDIKLKTEKQNQFLGDLFEGFLDQGVKQSEGQFFTPTPIVKFLISSLPLRQIIDQAEIPQVIDYACGAGHFLNEYAEQIKQFVIEKNGNISDYYGAIVGIEKEYRLSKVSKVASFMYGQDDIKIIYADALSDIKEVKDNTFTVLVANPPYSVKGFLETLTEEERSKYELFGEVSDVAKNNSIETFFVERAAQLLKSGGVAAIILPSSVLNNGNIYIKCREIILQHFDIVAIAEFGSDTFGKTDTNTVTLFLRRKAVNPSLAEHYKNRVDTWFNGDETKNEVFEDYPLLDAYCQYIGVPTDIYKTLFDNNLTIAKHTCSPNPQNDYEMKNMAAEPIAEYHTKTLMDYDIFKEYERFFDAKSVGGRIDTKGLNEKAKSIRKKMRDKAKTKTFKNLPLAEQDELISKELSSFIKEIEKDKVYYYMLAKDNKQPVVVVKSPSNKDDIKKYLGYEWSDAKGNEGIKYLNVAVAKADEGEGAEDDTMQQLQGVKGIQTPLFNPHNLLDSEKINSVIRQNFQNGTPNIPEQLTPFVAIYELVDMIDFARVAFDKKINTSATKKVEMKSKYPMVKLGGKDGVCEIKIGGTPSRKKLAYFTGNNLWVSISEMNGQVITDTKEKITDEGVRDSNVKLIPKGTTLLSFKLSIGKTAIAGANLYTNEAIAALIPKDKKLITDKYLFALFNGKMIDLENVGNKAFGKSLNSAYLNDEVQIPLPPFLIQQQIISECEKVDEEYNKSQQMVEEYKNKIAEVMNGVRGEKKHLGNIYAISSGGTPSRKEPKYWTNGTIPWLTTTEVNNSIITKTNEHITEEGLKNSSAKVYPINSLVIAMYGQGSTRGRTAKLGIETATNQACAVLYEKKIECCTDYVWAYLKSQYDNLRSISHGSAQPNLTAGDISNFVIPLPSLAEQQRIVSEIEQYEAKIAEAKSIMASSSERKKEILRKYLE